MNKFNLILPIAYCLCQYIYLSVSTFYLSIGHIPLKLTSQLSMHFAWNGCLHFWITRTESPFLNWQKQIAHWGYLRTACSTGRGTISSMKD